MSNDIEANGIPKGAPKFSHTYEILKVVGAIGGAIGVFIPLMTLVMQYRTSTQQRADENFRSVVEKLSAEKSEDRLASATSMGTFIKKGVFKGKFYDEAVDVLLNRLPVELDYNVLHAVTGSLERAETGEYKKIVGKLLAIERGFFIQEYPLRHRYENARKAFETLEAELREIESQARETRSDAEKVRLDYVKEESARKWKIYQKREEEYRELEMHQQFISDAVSIFLERITKTVPIEGLSFFRNSMNKVAILEINLPNSTIEKSAFSKSSIFHTKFNGAKIEDTVFTFSDLTKSSFADCAITSSLFDQTTLNRVDFSGAEFKGVFFTGSDVSEANFKGSRGLKPIYFYKAKNIHKAFFDEGFRRELDEQLNGMTEETFINYVNNESDLSSQRKKDIFNTLEELSSKEK